MDNGEKRVRRSNLLWVSAHATHGSNGMTYHGLGTAFSLERFLRDSKLILVTDLRESRQLWWCGSLEHTTAYRGQAH